MRRKIFPLRFLLHYTNLLYEEDFNLVFLPFSHLGQLTEYCAQIGKKPAIVTSPLTLAEIMPELIEHGINGYIVKWDIEAFLEHSLAAINHQAALTQNMQKSIESWNWGEKNRNFTI